ncbi:hypothetical protein HGO26_16845 [Shewanella sp. S-1]|uniref:Uncharacterized protein n=1 Tax=Shewanella oncorhynchi TaxID=2726434 RepID=A0ABX1KVW9_9GAMM|nr:hypothetical protein [Shewanella oncorhynchi]NLQ24540.1 hypothetical protein [Shewanella oncorhynchi]
MTISRLDLKVFKPEQLGSSDDAGGQRTKLAVESGKLNELFRAISDIDHAQSAVDIVKCYPALNTPDTSILLDGHVFISQKPTDDLVSLLIAEAATLDDADRMTDMVEILESSVRAGQLIRNRLIGLLAGQDTFPRPYLQSIYQFNGVDFYENITLVQGQTVVISVEYPGAENALYPRFEHFCQIQKTVTGGTGGLVQFKPAIPFDTPNYDITINGESGCTKLRYTSENDGIKYHGVTQLTAAATTEVLAVESTQVELLPKVKTISVSAGNALDGVSDSHGGTVGGISSLPSMYYKTVSLPSVSGQSTYIFELPDLLISNWFNDNGIQNVKYTGAWSQNASVTVTGTTVTVIFTGYTPPVGYSIGINYISDDKYDIYYTPASFPANRVMVDNRLYGEVTFLNPTYGKSAIKMGQGKSGVNASLVEPNGNIIAQIDATTGVLTKNPDFRGDFTYTYNCMLVETVPGEVTPPGDLTVEFILKSNEPILDTFYLTVSTTAETVLSASADSNGVVSGSGVSGTINNGTVSLTFTQRVYLSTLRYDISETVTLSPPPELYGLNPLRIKNGGVVNAFTAWNTVSVQHTELQVVSSPAPAQTYNARANARFVDITDAEGKSLWTLTNTHYTWVKATGVVTINSDFTGFTAPFILTDTIGEIALVTDVQAQALILASPLSQTYPIGANVSSVQNLGDLQARIGTVRDMSAWANNWDLDGAPATGNMNTVDFPIEVRNDTAVNEDWVLIFTSATAFRCVGRRLGQIATGDTLNDFAPVNPLTLQPYFIIRSGAFGGGWQAGEAIRFMSYAASKPVMLLRTVQSGHSQITTDRAVLAFRGNES